MESTDGSSTETLVSSEEHEDLSSTSRLPLYARLLNFVLCRSGIEDDALDAEPVTLSQLFRFSTRSERILISLGLFCAFVEGLFLVSLSVIYSFVCGIYLTTKEPKGNDEFLFRVLLFSLAYGVAGVIVYISSYLDTFLLNWTAENIVARIRLAYVSSVLNQDLTFLGTRSAGQLTSQLNNNIDRIREGIGEKLVLLVKTVVFCATAIVIIFITDARMAAVVVATYPISALIMSLIPRFAKIPTKEMMDATEKSDGLAQECILNTKTIASCNGEATMIEKYRRILLSTSKAAVKIGFFNGFFEGMTLFQNYLFYVATWWYGSYLYHRGELSDPGKILLIAQAIGYSSLLISFLAPHLISILKARASAAIVYRVIDRKPTIDSRATTGLDPTNVRCNIKFHDVHFSYVSRPQKVLDGLCWDIREGETIALAGHSGCGKSTSLSLITRLVDTNSDGITLDRVDIREYNVAQLRKMIGVVSQEPALFNGTIRENIRLGRDWITDEEITQSAKISNAHDFILSLEVGYDTKVGAGAISLSGGQQQRIAIARAIVTNPRILLLDEATSALDTKSEREVQKALEKASEGRTTIVVAHRLSTIRNTDRIYLIDNGQVIEEGTYDEMISRGGSFSKMAEMQKIEVSGGKEDAGEATGGHRSLVRSTSTTVEQQISRQLSKNICIIADTSVGSIKSIIRLIKICPWKYSTLILFSVLRGMENMFYAIFFRMMMRSVQMGADYWATLEFGLLGQLALSIYTWTMICGSRTAAAWTCDRISCGLRLNVFTSLLRKPCDFYDNANTSPAVCAVAFTREPPKVAAPLDARASQVFEGMISSATLIAYALIICYPNGVLALVYGTFIFLIFVKINERSQMASDALEKADTSGELAVEIFEQSRTIQILAVENYFIKRFDNVQQETMKLRNKICHCKSAVNSLYGNFIYFCAMLSSAVGSYFVYRGDFTVDAAYTSEVAVACTNFAVNLMANNLNDFIEAGNAAKRMCALQDRGNDEDDHETQEEEHDQNFENHSSDERAADLSFSHVDFAYPSRPNALVTRNVSFDVARSQSIALVGPSGSGKTTIIQLIERFYDPIRGTISLDSVPINAISKRAARKKVALVSQQPVLFNGTIYENVSLGVEGVTCADIRRVCRFANAAEFIESFPMGYETVIGDKGHDLSGGQKQRIAIARALIRNPRVILLDEATSALDSKSEQVVLAAIDQMMVGRTSVTVAHRLSTILGAKKICYFEDGRILETGSHEQLMAHNGRYASLVRHQCT